MQIVTSNFLRFAKAERTVARLVLFFEFGGHSSLVFRLFCPIVGLQRSTVKLKIVGTASLLSTSRRGLKAGPNKLLTAIFCSKLSSVKCSAQTRECFVGVKDSLFIFISHSLLSFWSRGNLKVLTFVLELLVKFIAAQNTMVFSEVQCELQTTTVFKFSRIFFSSPTVTSQVLFPTISRKFPRPLYDYEG